MNIIQITRETSADIQLYCILVICTVEYLLDRPVDVDTVQSDNKMKNIFVIFKDYFDWLPEFDLELKKVGRLQITYCKRRNKLRSDPGPSTSEKEAKLNDAKIDDSIGKKVKHKKGKENQI